MGYGLVLLACPAETPDSQQLWDSLPGFVDQLVDHCFGLTRFKTAM